MLSYLNDPKLKESTIQAMQQDVEDERLVKGSYWNEGQGNGCFVGCVIRGNEHSKFEDKLGIPRYLAEIADNIFENLEYEDSKKFSIDFLEAIPVGVDLMGIFDKLAYTMLVSTAHGVIYFVKNEKVKKAVQDIGDAFQRKINGEKVTIEEWQQLRKNSADASDASDAPYAYAFIYVHDSADAYASSASTYVSYADASSAYAYANAYVYAYADARRYASADARRIARSHYYITLAAVLINLFRAAGKTLSN